jgi:phosphate-selective porin OprO/OprP
VYKFPTDVWGNAFGDGGYGFSERVTAAPVYVEQTNQVLHLGGGFLIENPGRFPGTAATNNQFILRSIPEIGFTNGDFFSPGPQNGPFFAQTGLMQNIHYMEGYHLELASSYKSWTFQSEVFAMQISFNDGTSAAFPGAYAQTTYILTGEQKKYVKKSATYSGRIVPKHALGREGWGAWEVAGRWSYIDLSQTPVADAPRSGNMNTITLGLNWYWNANSKMQFNFVRVIQDQTTTNDYAYTNIFGVRTQFDF